MTASSERSFAQELNTWIQTIGIVIAALWGGYTFIYKEILLPKAAPVNVTVDLQLKKIGPPRSQLERGENRALIPVEMTVSAMNPSSRTIYLFPSMWIAYGVKVKPLPENQEFAKQVTPCVNMPSLCQIEKHAWIYSTFPAPVAVGRLLSDTFLKPNEKATRKIVFHVPPGQYDLIDVTANLPSVAKSEGAAWEWKYDEKTGGLKGLLYRVAKNGERKEWEKGKDGKYSDAELEYQMSASVSTLLLWQ